MVLYQAPPLGLSPQKEKRLIGAEEGVAPLPNRLL